MSGKLIFSPLKIRSMTIKNRFMRSPVYEAMSDAITGKAKPVLLRHIEKLAEGGIGLVIPGYVYITKKGQSLPRQTGFYDENTAMVWKDTIQKVHGYGSKLVFQICHGGNDCNPELTNDIPKGCSESPMMPNTKAMTTAEVEETIQQFINSAKLAERVGADGIELHGAHGYLISEFLSPAINKRTDKYGGSYENRIRIVKEIVEGIRKATDKNFTIGIKMNGHDGLDGGVTPELAAREVHDLDGIDFYEISCGLWNSTITIRSIVRGTIFKGLTQKQVEKTTNIIKKHKPGFELKEGYTLDYAAYVKKMNPNKIIASVGGWRELSKMEEAINSEKVDIISMGRPFIREPGLVNAFTKGKKASDCLSCAECIWRPAPETGVRCSYPQPE